MQVQEHPVDCFSAGDEREAYVTVQYDKHGSTKILYVKHGISVNTLKKALDLCFALWYKNS